MTKQYRNHFHWGHTLSRGFGHSGITDLKLRRTAKIDLASEMFQAGATRKEINGALERQFGGGLDSPTLRDLRVRLTQQGNAVGNVGNAGNVVEIRSPPPPHSQFSNRPRMTKVFTDDERLEILLYAEDNGDDEAMRRFGVQRDIFLEWKEAIAVPKAVKPKQVGAPVQTTETTPTSPVSPPPLEQKRGVQHPWKYTPEQIATAAQMLLDGVGPTEISRKTDVSVPTIANIAHGRHRSVPAEYRDKLATLVKQRPKVIAAAAKKAAAATNNVNAIKVEGINHLAAQMVVGARAEADLQRRINELEAQLSKSNARLRDKDAAYDVLLERLKTQETQVSLLTNRSRELQQTIADEQRANMVLSERIVQENKGQVVTTAPGDAAELTKLRNEAAVLRQRMGEMLVDAMLKGTTP